MLRPRNGGRSSVTPVVEDSQDFVPPNICPIALVLYKKSLGENAKLRQMLKSKIGN
jgi:hypothetical protein